MKSFPINRLDLVKHLNRLAVAILDSSSIRGEYKAHSDTKDELFANYTSWGKDYSIRIVVSQRIPEENQSSPHKIENVNATGEIL